MDAEHVTLRTVRLAGLATLLALTLATTACGSGANSNQPMEYDASTITQLSDHLRDQGSEAQADALKDGVISADEYQNLFDGLRKCIEDKGYGLDGPYTSPLTGTTLEFAYRDNGRTAEQTMPDYEECETLFWQPAAAVFAATSAQRMDGDFKAGVIQCLARAGEEASAEAITYAELVGTGASQTRIEKASECARDVAFGQNPDLITLSIIL